MALRPPAPWAGGYRRLVVNRWRLPTGPEAAQKGCPSSPPPKKGGAASIADKPGHNLVTSLAQTATEDSPGKGPQGIQVCHHPIGSNGPATPWPSSPQCSKVLSVAVHPCLFEGWGQAQGLPCGLLYSLSLRAQLGASRFRTSSAGGSCPHAAAGAAAPLSGSGHTCSQWSSGYSTCACAAPFRRAGQSGGGGAGGMCHQG